MQQARPALLGGFYGTHEFWGMQPPPKSCPLTPASRAASAKRIYHVVLALSGHWGSHAASDLRGGYLPDS